MLWLPWLQLQLIILVTVADMPDVQSQLDQLLQLPDYASVLQALTASPSRPLLLAQLQSSLPLLPEHSLSHSKLLALEAACHLDPEPNLKVFKCTSVYALVAAARGCRGKGVDVRGHFARNLRRAGGFWGAGQLEGVYGGMVGQGGTGGKAMDLAGRAYLWGFVKEHPEMLPTGHDIHEYTLKHMLMLRPDRKQQLPLFTLLMSLFAAHPHSQQTLCRHFRLVLQFFRHSLTQKQMCGLQPTIPFLQLSKNYTPQQLDMIFAAGSLGLTWTQDTITNCITNVIKMGISEASVKLLECFIRMFRSAGKYNELIQGYERNLQKVFIFLKFPQLYPASLKTLRLFLLGPWAVTNLYNLFAPKALQFCKLKPMSQHQDFLQLLAAVIDKYKDTTLVTDLQCILTQNDSHNQGRQLLSNQSIQQLRREYQWQITANKYDPFTVAGTKNDGSRAAMLEVRGIVNIGNSCYMNSFLQSLFMTRAYRRLILQASTLSVQKQVLAKLQSQHSPPSANLAPLARQTVRPLAELQHFFTLLYRSQRPCVSPHSIRKMAPVEFQNCHQHDAIEFGRFLLEAVARAVGNVFEGRLGVEIECPDCGARRGREEEFVDLMVASRGEASNQKFNQKEKENQTVREKEQVEREQKQQKQKQKSEKQMNESQGNHCQDIDDMIKLALQDQHIDNLTCQACSNPSPGKQSLKRHCITQYPNYLILTLKRFAYNTQTQTNSKLTYQLNLQPHFHIGNRQYILYSMIIHRGVSANSGHYYTFARASYDLGKQQWLCLNDSAVSVVGGFGKMVEFLQATPEDTPYILFGVEEHYLQEHWQRLEEPIKLRAPLQSYVEKDNAEYAKEVSNSKVKFDLSQLRNFTSSMMPYPRDDEDQPPGMGGFGNNPIM